MAMAHQPFWREALVEQRGLAIIGGAARHQDRQHQRQHGRLLDIRTFQQREHDARDQPGHRQVIGAVQPPEQPARQDQQREARHRVQHVADLQHRQRKDAPHPLQPVRQGRIGAREQQHRARERHQRADDLRRQLGQEPLHTLHGVAEAGAPGRKLVGEGQQRRQRQRQYEVDAAIGKDAADQRRLGNIRQHQDHQRLEHTDPARHVADRPYQDGDDVDGEVEREIAAGPRPAAARTTRPPPGRGRRWRAGSARW